MLNKVRKYICLLIAVVTVTSCFSLFAFAAEESKQESQLDFTVSTVDNCRIKPWKSERDGKYYFFLPSDCDMSSLWVRCGYHSVEVDGKKLEKGAVGAVTDIFKSTGEYKIKFDGNDYDVVFLKSKNLPSVYIKTESGSLDYVLESKDNKEKADIVICENGSVTADTQLEYIKGRGNSTWYEPKKPFNIKFTEKIDLFGLGKAKKWSLIASARENSLIRNKSVYDLADDTKLNFSPSSQHIDLYINNEYMGNYLVVESVEVKKNRVDIFDLEEANEKANASIDIKSCNRGGDISKEAGYNLSSSKWVEIPNDPEDITGGYLLEFEQQNRYHKEISGFVTDIGQPVTFKSPEYATKSEVEYISSYYQEFEDAVYSKDGKNSSGKYYTEYIDLDMMARMYIIQELAMNLDASTTSFYLYKDIGSDKFVASPVWDFDFSLGEEAWRDGVDMTDPTLWYARVHYIYDDRGLFKEENDTFPTLLAQLCTHKDFIEAVEKEWEQTFKPQVEKARLEEMQSLVSLLVNSAVMDAIRWDRYETTSVKKNKEEYLKVANGVIDFFEKRVDVLDKGLSSSNANLVYDANGGKGCTYNIYVAQVGEKVRVRRSNFNSDKLTIVFDSWNTKPDGSGKVYKPGSEIKLTDSETTLYAQWKEISLFRAVCAQVVKIAITVLYSIFDYVRGIIFN